MPLDYAKRSSNLEKLSWNRKRKMMLDAQPMIKLLADGQKMLKTSRTMLYLQIMVLMIKLNHGKLLQLLSTQPGAKQC